MTLASERSFGIRSCDLAGINHLDRFYLGREYPDIYYQQHRQNLFLVNLACTDLDSDIGENCFCMCTDTGPAARDHFDLQLFDLGGPGQSDEFMAVAGTPAGEALFDNPIFRRCTPEHVAKRRSHTRKSSTKLQVKHLELVFGCRSSRLSRRGHR